MDGLKEKIAKGILAPYLKGNRKLLAFLVYVGAVVGIAYTGKVDGFEADTALQWGFGFFVGGNVGEHASNGTKKKAVVNNVGTDKPAAPMVLLAAGLLSALLLAAPAPAQADVLPFIDKLDIQIGTGLEFVDLKPFRVEPVMLGTAQIYQEPRTKLELRIGGTVSDVRRALIFSVTRDLTPLLLRNDSGTEKVLLPPVGVWFGGDLASSEEGDKSVDFLWGVNAAWEF